MEKIKLTQKDWSRSKKIIVNEDIYICNVSNFIRYNKNNYIRRIKQDNQIYFSINDILKYNDYSIMHCQKTPFFLERNEKEYCSKHYAFNIGANQGTLNKIKDSFLMGGFKVFSIDEIKSLLQNKENNIKLENTTTIKALRKYIESLGEEVIRETKGSASLKSIKISSLNYRLEYYADSYTVEIYKLGKLQRFYYLNEFLKFCERIK